LIMKNIFQELYWDDLDMHLAKLSALFMASTANIFIRKIEFQTSISD
jgi:hypothetical protein